jgi:hypothetical protein
MYSETLINIFIGGPEKEQWIRENDRPGIYSLNRT